MVQLASAGSRWLNDPALIRSQVLCLLAQAFVAALMTWTLGPAMAEIGDMDVLDPSGLMLLEVLRVLWTPLSDAFSKALVLGMVAVPLLCACHLRLMLDSVRSATSDSRLRRPLDALPSYVALHVMKLTVVSSYLFACFKMEWGMYRWLDRALTTVSVSGVTAAHIVLFAGYLSIVLVFDSLKLHFSCLAGGPSGARRFVAALSLLAARLPTLLLGQATRSILALTLSSLVYLLHRSSEPASWVAIVLTQGAVFVALFVETWWYRRLATVLEDTERAGDSSGFTQPSNRKLGRA